MAATFCLCKPKGSAHTTLGPKCVLSLYCKSSVFISWLSNKKWGSFDLKSFYEINIKCEIGLVINIHYYGCIIYIHILHIIWYHLNWKGKFLVIDNIWTWKGEMNIYLRKRLLGTGLYVYYMGFIFWLSLYVGDV